MEYSLGAAQNLIFDVSNILHELCEETSCTDVKQMKKEAFSIMKKEDLAECMYIVVQGLKRCTDVLKTTTAEVDKLKNTVISLQSEKIKNQEQLVKSKNETVETFQSTLQSEMKSYSDVCASNIQSSVSSSLLPQNISNVVKKVVSDEDKRRNIILYGVKEEEGVQPERIVSTILERIGEKPPIIDCVRVGSNISDGNPRPIKVTLKNYDAARSVHRKSKQLKEDPTTKRIFIAPDRSREERAERKKLVTELKEKIRSDPSRFYYRSGNEVKSRERVNTVQQIEPVSEIADRPTQSVVSDFDNLLQRAKATHIKLTSGAKK